MVRSFAPILARIQAICTPLGATIRPICELDFVHLGGQTICYATVLRWIGLVGLRDAWDPLRNKI